MSLQTRIETLATRIGAQIKGLIHSDHPGLARALVNFGYVGGALQINACHNVTGVTRLAPGR